MVEHPESCLKNQERGFSSQSPAPRSTLQAPGGAHESVHRLSPGPKPDLGLGAVLPLPAAARQAELGEQEEPHVCPRPAPSPEPRGAARCGTTTRHPVFGARAAPPASLLIMSFPGVLTAAALPPVSPPSLGVWDLPTAESPPPALSQGPGQGWGLPQPDPFRLTPSQPRLPPDPRAERKAVLSLPAEVGGGCEIAGREQTPSA